MKLCIALAGNPNSGKTTLFNALTGSNQFVGNWPGVTVEKKEGKYKEDKEVTIADLPGIYSLSPYTLEEVVARNYLVDERPDAILNIIDGTNLERNLYLTTQLAELGIPMVLAVNMMDVVEKNGDKIDLGELSKQMGAPVVAISALKGKGITAAVEKAAEAAKEKKEAKPRHVYSGVVEHALAHIEELALHDMDEGLQRWYAIKLFERDEKIREKLNLPEEMIRHMERDIAACEEELDDDAESIITGERYQYIGTIISGCVKKKERALTTSDKIDRIVTNRILALPIFAVVMFLVYYISMVTVGAAMTDWTNDCLFGDGFRLFGAGNHGIFVPSIPDAIDAVLQKIGCAPWLEGLVIDGIVAGVGAVLGFVPQMLVLFLLLAFLESCGYMARIAFIMDRIFRRFGLSGKSFIPMLVGTGCGVPGIMASRTIENDRDRKMTIMTTTFIPCGAKMPFVAMIAGAIFDGSPLVSTGAYFIGIAAVIFSGIMLKKTKAFSGDPAPFVMELPAYHWPTVGGLLRSMWERGWSFIRKAGTIILLSTIVVWFTSFFGFVDGRFCMLGEDEIAHSLLAAFSGAVAWIFTPLGWGNWQATVASLTGLVAKENIVGTMGILYGIGEGTVYRNMGAAFTAASGMSFMVFNLLCAPCFAAMGAIRREMNNTRWFWAAIGYQCGLAYAVGLIVYQIGALWEGGSFGIGTAAAFAVIAAMLYLLCRRPQEDRQMLRRGVA